MQQWAASFIGISTFQGLIKEWNYCQELSWENRTSILEKNWKVSCKYSAACCTYNGWICLNTDICCLDSSLEVPQKCNYPLRELKQILHLIISLTSFLNKKNFLKHTCCTLTKKFSFSPNKTERTLSCARETISKKLTNTKHTICLTIKWECLWTSSSVLWDTCQNRERNCCSSLLEAESYWPNQTWRSSILLKVLMIHVCNFWRKKWSSAVSLIFLSRSQTALEIVQCCYLSERAETLQRKIRIQYIP